MTTIREAANEIQSKIDNNERILSYISNDNLIESIKYLAELSHDAYVRAMHDVDLWNNWDFWKNGIDPFTTVTSTVIGKYTGINDYFSKVESVRQLEKKISQATGKFHQKLLGNLEGCINPGDRGIIDLIVDRPELKLIAEIKNKFHTKSGTDVGEPYTKLQNLIDTKYLGYTGYLVLMIPKPRKAKGYKAKNQTYHPKKFPEREDIREIDGKSFYTLLTGKDDALKELYLALPKLLSYHLIKRDIESENIRVVDQLDAHYQFLWDHIYSKDHGGEPPKG